MEENEVIPRFVEIGGKEYLLLATRLDRVEYPSSALRRTEHAFNIAQNIPDAGKTMRFEEKPIEVDVEPVTEPVMVEEVTTSHPPPPKREPPPEIPLEPPSDDNWRVTVLPPSTIEPKQKRERKRSSLLPVALVIIILLVAVAALHFTGVFPLDTLLNPQKEPVVNPRSTDNIKKRKNIKPFADAFSFHLLELIRTRLGDFTFVSPDTRTFSHITDGVMLRVEIPVDWKTHKRDSTLYVDAGSMCCAIFGVRLKEAPDMALLRRVLEEKLGQHLRRVCVTPSPKGLLCTARKSDDLFWGRIWVEDGCVVAVLARGHIQNSDLWFKPLEKMVVVLGEVR